VFQPGHLIARAEPLLRKPLVQSVACPSGAPSAGSGQSAPQGDLSSNQRDQASAEFGAAHGASVNTMNKLTFKGTYHSAATWECPLKNFTMS
jgi:hypothetical protein